VRCCDLWFDFHELCLEVLPPRLLISVNFPSSAFALEIESPEFVVITYYIDRHERRVETLNEPRYVDYTYVVTCVVTIPIIERSRRE
jgi:hypothetical protein